MEQHLDLLYRGISRPGAWHDFADNLCSTLGCDDVVVRLDATPHQNMWWLDEIGHEATISVALSPACVLKLILRRAAFKPEFGEEETNLLKGLGPHIERAFRLGLENSPAPSKWLAISRFLSELQIAMVFMIGDTKHINEYANYLFGHVGDDSDRFFRRIKSRQEPIQVYSDELGDIEFSFFQDDLTSGFVGYQLLPKIEDKLSVHYSLTKTEKYICRLLAEGLSFDAIVGITQRSKETTRTHSKKIYKKMSVKGQVELVNLINRLEVGLKRRV